MKSILAVLACALTLAGCASNGDTQRHAQDASQAAARSDAESSSSALRQGLQDSPFINGCPPYIRPREPVLLIHNQTSAGDTNYVLRLSPERRVYFGVGKGSGEHAELFAGEHYEVHLTYDLASDAFKMQIVRLEQNGTSVPVWPDSSGDPGKVRQDGTLNRAAKSHEPIALVEKSSGIDYHRIVVFHRDVWIKMWTWAD